MLETSKIWYPIDGQPSTFEDSTLIIPSVAIGNVSQLAIDLFIHTFSFEKIGNLSDIYMYPFAAPSDYRPEAASEGISTPIEVYYNSDFNLVLIQQRSPIIPGFTAKFVENVIIPFIELSKVKKLILLDSSDAGMVTELKPGLVRLYTNEDLLDKSFESLKLTKHAIPLYQEPYGHSLFILKLTDSLRGRDLKTIEIKVLVSYVYEGDNFEDGEVLANELIKLGDLSQPSNWTRPVSWLGVYGDMPVPSAMEEGLYG